MQGVFRKHDEIECRHARLGFPDHAADLLRLIRQILRGDDSRQLKLHDADDDAVRRLVQSAKTVHGCVSSL